MPKYVEMEWRTYAERVVPEDAPPVQIQESRRAFYAGAQSFLNIMMVRLDPDTEPTDADLHMMDEIHDELQQFMRDVVAGKK